MCIVHLRPPTNPRCCWHCCVTQKYTTSCYCVENSGGWICADSDCPELLTVIHSYCNSYMYGNDNHYCTDLWGGGGGQLAPGQVNEVHQHVHTRKLGDKVMMAIVSLREELLHACSLPTRMHVQRLRLPMLRMVSCYPVWVLCGERQVLGGQIRICKIVQEQTLVPWRDSLHDDDKGGVAPRKVRY